MKMLGYLEKSKGQNEESRPSFSKQVRVYINETKQKIKNNDSSFRTKAIILLVIYLYITGVLASIYRYFGEIIDLGFGDSPKPTITPWGAIGALFSFKYSLPTMLVTLLIAFIILLWWIRNHIGLGSYEFEERGGLKFKKQSMDATLGSAREMNQEEMLECFTVVPAVDFFGDNNPGRIIFGRDLQTNDYVTEKTVQQGDRPNRNTITVGSAGSYKTSNFIIPLIMQLSRAGENMIINDSSTEISKATYHLLKSRGYEIKIFNMLNPEVSDGWNFIGAVGKNPLLSKSFARMIIDSFVGKGTGGDPFWPEGMYVLMSALILLVNSKENNTIEEIRHILNQVDLADIPDLFENLDDNHPAKMEFNTYLTSPVQRNVKSGAAQRLSIFNSSPISKICSSDGINIIDDLATPGKKTAIFIVTSAVDSTFSFIPSLFLTAAAVQLSDHAANKLENLTLPQPVHFIMDEFSNTGRIADIGRYLSATRKFGLVFHLIVQSFPQFYQRYEENEVLEILGNCQYTLCFGAGEPMTAEFFEKYCGPTTVRTSMTQSQSVVLKNTDNFREGEQQRSLFFANEILTMDKHEYLLLTNGMPPLRLKKVYWKNLEDRRFVKDFQMKYYEPQSCLYRPPSSITDKTDQSGNNTEAFGTGSDNTFEKSESYNVHEPRYRSEKDTGKKPGERKKKTEYTSFAETPPMFQARYYIERPPINKDDIVINVDGNSDSICCFKNNKDKSGKPRQAILIRYNIDATAYTIRGTVPENRYVPAKTKLDLINLENRCNLYKEDCILIGWKCKYTRGTKLIEMKRLKINGTEKYLNENEQVVKSYSFILPKSDCEISPIFDSGKGTKKQGSKGAKSSEIRSTKNSVMKM